MFEINEGTRFYYLFVSLPFFNSNCTNDVVKNQQLFTYWILILFNKQVYLASSVDHSVRPVAC